MFRNTSALPRGATIKVNITQLSALRPGHITNIAPQTAKPRTSMWPSNVLRVVVVLLRAFPTLRAAECVALIPTESAAKDGRCLYGKPRGEWEGLFPKREEVWGCTFSIWRVCEVRPS